MASIRLFIKWLAFVMAPRWLILMLRPSIPRKPSDDPSEHSDYEIGWGLQDSWGTVVEEHIALLETEPDVTSDPISWSNLETSPAPSSPDFEEVILIKGGSYETYLYFRTDEYSTERATPGKPFVELHYHDGTEQIIASDLTRSAPMPERTRFEDGGLGTLWDDPPVDGVGDRLRGGQWGDIPIPPRAVTGETVRATTFTNWPEPGRDRPLYDLTVLGEPEVFDDRTLRVPLRITSRHDELRLRSLDFQLSSSPDTFGRIHVLWESLPLYREGADLPDSLPGVTLEAGQTREGYVYFRGPDDEASPTIGTFTVFWYGDYLFGLPVVLDEMELAYDEIGNRSVSRH